ncbi:MAG: family 10 glycosylhydrolase [Betaproteobacteria bacterium]|nr:family 10 glycosylhydrolase [Betaproteobacteria bacterium]
MPIVHMAVLSLLSRAAGWVLPAALAIAAAGCAVTGLRADVRAELRGTWITTTANTAVATPRDTAGTMQQLKSLGLNTVYLEVWKNGATHHPSDVLQRVLGAGAPVSGRDLTEEMLIEAQRNALVAVAWFEYGFMAAHASSMNALRRAKPEWLLRDIDGRETAPDGFVWMNPAHPEVRRFLIDLVLEAVDRYDLDGIQWDDRLAWPSVTMGYDEFTRRAFAREHAGQDPPRDPREPAWVRWRAGQVESFARQLVAEVRARRPGLVISLSPAVHPWSREHHLIDWPRWAAWRGAQWDEFVPQAYRSTFPEFDATWRVQRGQVGDQTGDLAPPLLVAGIRATGDGRDTWDSVRDSIQLTRTLGGGGHALWFSRGVLGAYAGDLGTLYTMPARNPHFPSAWRPGSRPLHRAAGLAPAGQARWVLHDVPPGTHRLIGHDGERWSFIDRAPISSRGVGMAQVIVDLPPHFRDVEILVDRREDLRRPRRTQP